MLGKILCWFGWHTSTDRQQHTHDEFGVEVPGWTNKNGEVLTTYRCQYCDRTTGKMITYEPKDKETE